MASVKKTPEVIERAMRMVSEAARSTCAISHGLHMHDFPPRVTCLLFAGLISTGLVDLEAT
jgi:hypothetical protein